MKSKADIFNNVLYIGPNYIQHKGGIGSVLESYSQNIKNFNFLATYPSKKYKYKVSFIPKYLVSIFHLIKILFLKKSIKIVHIHGAANGSLIRKFFIFLISKYLFKKKVIFHCHGGRIETYYLSSNIFTKKIINHFFCNVDLIICLSSKWKLFFESNFLNKNVLILENIIQEHRITSRLDCGCTHKKKLRMLFMGTINKDKGLYDLIDLIENQIDYFKKNYIVDVCGIGHDDKLLALICDKKYSDIIVYHGWLTGIDKETLLENCDIFLLPSYFEALPVSILEAMNFGKPIVSTDIGGIPDIVFNNVNGFLFEPGDINTLFRIISYFHLNQSDMINKGIQSKNLVTPYYSTNVIRKLSIIYSNILHK